MNLTSERSTYFMGFIAILMMIGLTFYLEKYDGLIPCPLCLLQRISFSLLGAFFLLGVLISQKKSYRLFVGLMSTLMALSGLFLSGRQVWLQHLPPDSNADCGMSLQYLMKVLPFDQVMAKIMQGTAECSQKGWEFLHLSLAEWSFICFGVFFLLCLLQVKRALSN